MELFVYCSSRPSLKCEATKNNKSSRALAESLRSLITKSHCAVGFHSAAFPLAFLGVIIYSACNGLANYIVEGEVYWKSNLICKLCIKLMICWMQLEWRFMMWIIRGYFPEGLNYPRQHFFHSRARAVRGGLSARTKLHFSLCCKRVN